ncbi:MAG: indole-3-glycerol phosphate synthase TrpC [Planctomycetota bacterium]|nr:MAG: indole-3-glycerol phosphate synthase TrpC [Planctomycetota bacterium]
MPIALEEIIAGVREELAERKRRVPEPQLAERIAALPPAPSLRRALSETARPRVIAEIKRRSPSAGALADDLDPVAQARRYAEAGAAAISVLTEPRHFGGSLADLEAVARSVELPVLRKDFVLDPYQLLEARAHGAAAVLLIAAVLEPARLEALIERAHELGLEVLVEVHEQAEAVALYPFAHRIDAVGVNNRCLRTMRVSLETARRLAPALPPGMPRVAESGIARPADIAALEPLGYDAFLVGSALVRAPDPAAMLRWLRSDVTAIGAPGPGQERTA